MSITEQLTKACDGLLMMSESDYPFEVFLWPGQAQEALTDAKLLQLTKHSQDSPVEIVDLDNFFHHSVEEKDWQDKKQKNIAKKFQGLVETLKANLTDIKVYYVGKINRDVYIIGKTQSNDLAGISTKVVET